MTELDLIKQTQTIIGKLGKTSLNEMDYCRKRSKWQLNELIEKPGERKMMETKLKEHFGERGELRFGPFFTQAFDKKIYLVSGSFQIGFSYDINVVYCNAIAERIIIHGHCTEPVLHVARSGEDRFFMIHESEVRYVDVHHNNCIWHCTDYDARERITLKRIEMYISEGFCKINKSCIVNLNHVRTICKYEVLMDNNEKLFISRRYYPAVKKKIQEWRPKQ